MRKRDGTRVKQKIIINEKRKKNRKYYPKIEKNRKIPYQYKKTENLIMEK